MSRYARVVGRTLLRDNGVRVLVDILDCGHRLAAERTVPPNATAIGHKRVCRQKEHQVAREA